MKLTGSEIANSGVSKFTQNVCCPWCNKTASLDLGPQHVTGDLSLHCQKCGRFSRHKTADKWFDQHQERFEELKNVWKKIPGSAYLTCRQGTKGTPWIYTIFLGGADRPQEYMSRDIIDHILTSEWGMSGKQASGILASAVLTPGQRIYLQRWARLVMAAEARETMKRTGVGDKEFLIKSGSPIRCNGQDGIFLRYSGNEGFAIVALPASPDSFGDAEVPVLDLEVLDAGGPEVAEDFEMDKELDEVDDLSDLGEEQSAGGLEEALEHIEVAEEIVEDLVLDEVSDHPDDKHKDQAEAFEEEEAGESDKHEEHKEEVEEDDDGDHEFRGHRRAAADCTCDNGYDRHCPDHGAKESRRPARRAVYEDKSPGHQEENERQTKIKEKNHGKSPAVCNHGLCTKKAVGDTDYCSEHGDKKSGQRRAYLTKDDYAVMERPQHKTVAPKVKEHKSDMYPKESGGGYPKNPREDKKLEDARGGISDKQANRHAQRRVHVHYSHSGDLKRAIDVNRRELSIEDIRDLCRFYANTGKIANHEADDIARWFLGTKPRLLSARDLSAEARCTCKGETSSSCPKHSQGKSKTCQWCGDLVDNMAKHMDHCSGKSRNKAALSVRDLRASDEAGQVEVPDADPTSGVSSGSGATDTPDPKRQPGESANSITGPEKVKDHGAGDSPKDAGDVEVPDLGVPKGASTRLAFDDENEREGGDCSQCGGPLIPLGSLGSRKHYRCRNCGAQSSKTGRSALGKGDLKQSARHKDGCGCGFCSRMRDNQSAKGKPAEALSKNDMRKVAHDEVGIFMPALHNGTQVLVIAVDNTSLRATVQDGNGKQRQVDFSDLTPTKTGPYSGRKRKLDPGAE